MDPLPARPARKQKKKKNKRRLLHPDKLSRAVAIKQELQSLVDAVRNKFKVLRQNADDVRGSIELGTKPFIEPLQKVVADSIRTFVPVPIKQEVKTERPTAEQEGEEEKSLAKRLTDISTQTERTSLPAKYLDRLADPSYKTKLDFVYGVRPDGSGGTLIGDSKISFSNNKLYVKDQTFNITRGLLELLFMKIPSRLLFNQNDLMQYKAILLLTSAHLQSYSDKKTINANRGKKYTSVISPLFFPRKEAATPTKDVASGSGVHVQKHFAFYNDNINTLVNRLRLLVLSHSAGYTGHDSEVLQIIGTLREHRIIE